MKCWKAAVTLTWLLLDQRANKGPVGGQLEVVNDEMNKPMEKNVVGRPGVTLNKRENKRFCFPRSLKYLYRYLKLSEKMIDVLLFRHIL